MSVRLRVEFKVAVRKPRVKPKSPDRADLQRRDRAARRARNLALAYWVDGLIRSGAVADLAAVARMCRVSRARISTLAGMLGIPISQQSGLLTAGRKPPEHPDAIKQDCGSTHPVDSIL